MGTNRAEGAFPPALDDRTFDGTFYRELLPELASLDEVELAKFWQETGKEKCPIPNAKVLIAKLIQTHGTLPPDFDPAEYRYLNGDLCDVRYDWQAVKNYLEVGRAEGRVYSRRELQFYRDYHPELARVEDAGLADYCRTTGRGEESPRSLKDFLSRNELISTD